MAKNQSIPRLPAWTPFQRVYPVLSKEKREQLIREIMRASKEHGAPMSRYDAESMMDSNEREEREMYQNSRYTVLLFRHEETWPGAPETIHLSIRRNDRTRPREERYRDFQRIKTELVGAENEGVELYPSESRVADCADQYHIYVLVDPEMQFPFGFRAGMRMGPSAESPVAQSAFEE
jgi:hypothetical protein